jgi:hypothetical protein
VRISAAQTCRPLEHTMPVLVPGLGDERDNFLGLLVPVEPSAGADLLCKEVANEWEKFVIARSNLYRL